jgi:hypothetical protein
MIQSTNDLITLAKTRPGLSEYNQIDFIQRLELPDLPPHILNLHQGDPCFLSRNISTASALVKGLRCCGVEVKDRLVVVKLDTKQELTLARIPMEKLSNGMKSARGQVSIRLIYVRTVHRSQGITVKRAVIDSRSHFWEHGQLRATLSSVTDPVNLYFPLPGSSDLR